MKIPVPFAELSFTWKLTINIQTILDEDGDDKLSIQQLIEFNGDQEGGRADLPASQPALDSLQWRLGYLVKHLQAKLARAVTSLNREALAFTDFFQKAGVEAPQEVTLAFLEPLAEQLYQQAILAIRNDGKEQIQEAIDRFDQARRELLRERLPVIKRLCEQIKNKHDLLKRQSDTSRKRGVVDSKEWEALWLKQAPLEYGVPDEILRLFARGKTAGEVANLIVGLELNYRETTVDTYKKPSKRTRAEKQRRERELRAALAPEVYGAPSRKVEIRTGGEDKGS